MDVNLIKEKIEASIENAQVNVKDTNGTGDHFSILVISNIFNNMSLVNRHKMIHKCLKKYLNNEIHAIQLQTLSEKEYENQ